MTSTPLATLLSRRILVLDGAMGTMIQRRKLDEARLPRRPRLADHPRELKGNNDLIALTRPDVLAGDPRGVPGRRRRHHRDQHLLEHGHRPGRLRPRGAGLRAEPRVGADRPRASPTPGRRGRPTGRASSPARSGRPTSRCRSRPKVDDPAFRAATFDEVRLAYREQVRGLLDGGVDVLLVETIFDTLNVEGGARRHRRGAGGARHGAAADDLGDHHRPQRPHALGPDPRRLLHLDRARPAVQRRHQLRARRARDAAVHGRARPHRRHAT